MRIIHRISISSSRDIQRELAELGIAVRDSGLVSFNIDENLAKEWPDLEDWIQHRRAVDVVSTKFSRKEILAADWLELVPEWHFGYPQPDDGAFGYRQASYDLSDWCGSCGIGMMQNAPFQMKREPKWGKRGILQLNWVFDEFFAKPAVWERVFRPYGVGFRPVVNTKGRELKTVGQIVVGEEVDIVTVGLPAEICRRCGRRKYLPVGRGRFPALVNKPPTAIVKTSQYFGSGAAAHKRVLVSQSVAHALVVEKVGGVSLRPLSCLSPEKTPSTSFSGDETDE